MFKKMDILNPEMMVPNVRNNHLTMGNCKNMKVNLNVKNSFPIKRMLRSNGIIKIPANLISIILFKLRKNLVCRQVEISYSYFKNLKN